MTQLPPIPTPMKATGSGAGTPLFVISGGSGALGQQLIRTVMAQFKDTQNPVHVFPKTASQGALQQLLKRAVEEGAIVIHSLVNQSLRDLANEFAREHNLHAIDVVGPVLDTLSVVLEKEPLGVPGLYRDLHKSYFERIDAINYTLDHDDGKNFEGWGQAEIILVGVSRVGKTPLSLYLSMLGWRVANIPLVAGIPPHKALFKANQNRVVGLKIDPDVLLTYRSERKKDMGIAGYNDAMYADPEKVYLETKEINQFMRRQGYPIINTTRKPIEATAGEVVHVIQRKLKKQARLQEKGG